MQTRRVHRIALGGAEEGLGFAVLGLDLLAHRPGAESGEIRGNRRETEDTSRQIGINRNYVK